VVVMPPHLAVEPNPAPADSPLFAPGRTVSPYGIRS
jgi:hypothetical protein